MRFSKNYILDNLFYTSIFLFPIDSFPLFPTGNVYRPISVFFLIFYVFVWLFFSKKVFLKSHDIIVIALSLFFFIQSLFTSYFIFDSFEHIPKTIITLILCCVILFTTNDYFYRHRFKIPLNKIIKVLKASFLLCCIIGFIQLMGIIGVIPNSFQSFVTKLFSYRSVGRMQMVSGEPSMMFRHLLLFLAFFLGVKTMKNRKLYITLVSFFIIFSGSTYGYVLLVLCFSIYILLFRFSILLKPMLIFSVIITIFILTVLYSYFLDQYTVNKIDLVISVFSNPDTITNYLKRDGSFFQRLINPLIGFQSTIDFYGLGTGLDTYRYVYPRYILEDYPYALNHSSVRSAVEGTNYITPKSLYSKLISELGVLPFFLYLLFFIKMWVLILRKKYNNKLLVQFIFILCLVYGINTDTIIYVNLLFLIYILYYLLKFDEIENSTSNI